MSSALHLYYRNALIEKIFPPNTACTPPLKSFEKNDRKILQALLLRRLHRLFCELFRNKLKDPQSNLSLEHYSMDSKIIQLLIQDIVSTGAYTLEGIAYHTNIPFDVIYEAACSINNKFSVTLWIKIIDLYAEVKPDVAQGLFDKLLNTENKNCSTFLSLLKEA